jgi:DNA recombination protein RmuC
VTNILLIMAVVLLIAAVVLLLMLLRKASQTDATMLASRLDAFEKAQERTERAVREEVSQSRDELGKAAREQRQELTEAFKTFGDSVVQRMMDGASVQKGQLELFPVSLPLSQGERGATGWCPCRVCDWSEAASGRSRHDARAFRRRWPRR